jgi:hypothetical protein
MKNPEWWYSGHSENIFLCHRFAVCSTIEKMHFYNSVIPSGLAHAFNIRVSTAGRWWNYRKFPVCEMENTEGVTSSA